MKKNREEDFAEIRVRVIPRSSRSEIAGREGDTYRVKIASPPVDGAANKALIELLAKSLGLSKRSVRIISGETSRLKTIRIHGLKKAEVLRMLGGDSPP
ncbi:MAG: YggU family protein [Deltaproteobacteria bacterium]|nr:YggU family protein [Deltaproteobacteria bacterium]